MMTEPEGSPIARLVGLVLVSLIAGAVFARWHAPRQAARIEPREEAAFAAPILHQRSAPGLSARVMESFSHAPKPLPDELFADTSEPGQAAFEDIAGPLKGPNTQFRALGTPDGSYLRDRAHGWYQFRGQHWVPVKRAVVPDAIVRRWPDADPQAMHREEPSRDGDTEGS